MATAKLWWNGSSWITSDTTCVSKTSKSGSSWGLLARIKLIAYDNGKIRLYASVQPDGVTGSSNSFDGTLSTSYGGVSANVSNGSRSGSADLRSVTSSETSSTTGTISYSTPSSGMSCVYYSGGAHYGQKLTWSGSVSVGTSPFATISFDANGGSDAPASQTVCKNVNATLTADTPNRTGYTFSGWNTSADGTGTSYSAGGTINISSDTTLYAQWSTNLYPVSISADEGVTITFDGVAYTNTTVTVNKPYGSVCAYTITANGGFIIKTRDPATDGSMTIDLTNPSLSATSQRVGCHLDDGDNWVQAVMYYDDGDQWQMVQAYYDDGASWNLVF